MTIQDLIAEGMDVTSRSFHNDPPFSYYYGSEYEKWLRKAMRYLEAHFSGDKDTKRFCEIAEKANGSDTKHFDSLVGILEAFDCITLNSPMPDITELIFQICRRFQVFDANIKRRHNGRSTIVIKDEYDIQDALGAILRLFVDDVRPEEYVPSYAGANSRVDFLLPDYGIIIETKYASQTLKDKGIGEQLTIDFHRYKELGKGNHLICFVYDKDSNIVNPAGLISDLESLSDDELKISVIISP